MEIEQTTFDYGDLPVETREFVKGKELSIKARTSQTIWENGRDLLEVKERLEHGQFQKWVEGNFPWSYRTAVNMMNVAKNLKVQDSSLLTIANETLFLLSQNSTPESARTEAIEKAESGEQITHKQAKDLIEAHKAVEEKTRHIEMLENTVKSLQEMLPTEDILQKIASLEQQLAQAKNQKPQTIEVPPPGYEQLKIDLRQAQNRARELDEALVKEKQKLQVEVVPEKYRKMEDDYKQAQEQVEKLGRKLLAMSDVERDMKNDQFEIDASNIFDEADKKIRKGIILLSGLSNIKRTRLILNSIDAIERSIEQFKEQFNTLEVSNDIIDV